MMTTNLFVMANVKQSRS